MDFKLPRSSPESSAVPMKIIVTVMDPYSQQPDDLDPSPIPIPISSQPLSQLNAGASTTDLLLDDVDHDSQQRSAPPSHPHPLSPGTERGKGSDLKDDTPPQIHTAKQIDAILRGLKAALSDFAATYFTVTRPLESEQLPLRLENSAVQRKISEDTLLAMMSGLPSIDSILECAVWVDNVELFGDVTLNASKSASGEHRAEVRAAPLFSISFHRTLHRLIKVVASRSPSVSLHALEQEMKSRDRLLEAYSSFSFEDRDRDRDRVLHETVTVSARATSQVSEDKLVDLSKENSPRAEAAYSLCAAQRRCDRPDNMGQLSEKHRIISFSLYRCLHFLSDGQLKEAAENPYMPPSLRRVIAAGSCLRANKDRIVDIEINDISLLSSGGGVDNTCNTAAQSLWVPGPVCSAAACFLVGPLFVGDVFGLLCYSSALGLSGLTPSSSLQYILPCAVVRLESCWEEASSILLMDVSSSPLQR